VAKFLSGGQRMARAKKSEVTLIAVPEKRRGRPKGSKNKTTVAARTNRSIASRGQDRPKQQALAPRIEAMIRELEGLRAEVLQLEGFSDVLRQLRRTIG
jgi:hypothetical protein